MTLKGSQIWGRVWALAPVGNGKSRSTSGTTAYPLVAGDD